MSFDNYRRALQVPRLKPLLLLAVLCRIPASAAAVVLTLHVVLSLDHGYGAAGLVGAVATLGMALGSPWRGRRVDRLGLRKALIPSLVVETLAWGIGPFLPYPGLLVSVLVGGLFMVPVFSVVRASIAALAPPAQRRSAFALDSMGTEVTFMIGPAGGVLLATQVSSTVAMLAVGVLTLGAGLALFALNPPITGTPHGLPRPERQRGLLRDPRLLAVLGATASTTLVLAGMDVAIVAFTRHHDAVALAGVIASVWAAGSLVGGLLFGAMSRPVSPMWLLLALGLLTVPVGLVAGPHWLLLSVIPAGFLCAPTLTATTEAVTRLVPEHARGEVMGWYGSATTLGLAVGSPLAGAVVDASGPWAGFAAVGAAGVLLGLAGLAVERRGARRAQVADTAVVPREFVAPSQR